MSAARIPAALLSFLVAIPGLGLGLAGVDGPLACDGCAAWWHPLLGEGSAAVSGHAQAIAFSPDGARVFAAGLVRPALSEPRLGVVAFDALAGAPLWAAIDPAGTQTGFVQNAALAVTPDASTVLVRGVGYNSAGRVEARDAGTGALLWSRTLSGGPAAMALAPEGEVVFVAHEPGTSREVLALDVTTGAPRWIAGVRAATLALSPDGATLLVVTHEPWKTVLLALEAATGAQRWKGPDAGRYVAFSPGSDVAFVGDGQWTKAIDVASGERLWDVETHGAWPLLGVPDRVVLGVAGYSPGGDSVPVARALDAASGAALWTAWAPPIGIGSRLALPAGVALSPDGARVYVGSTGSPDDFDRFLGAFDVATGDRIWSHDAAPNGALQKLSAVAVSPDGSRVAFAGAAGFTPSEFSVVAYGTDVPALAGPRSAIRE